MPIRTLSRARVVAAVTLLLGLVAGCGGGAKTVTVSGKVVLPTKVKLAETDNVTVLFVPEDSGGKSSTLSVNAKDLTFSGDVMPGKYKVGVTVTPYAGMKDNQAHTKELAGQVGAFNTNGTPLRYEVTNESQSITVDLTKPGVSKP